MIYYVDATGGNDGNTGQAELQAWQTIGKVATEFNNGTFNAGDEILLKRGETWNINADAQRLHIRVCSGAIGNHIVVADYSSGALPCLDAGATSRRVVYHSLADVDSNYITIRNIRVTNVVDTAAVRIESVHHWLFDTITVDNVQEDEEDWCAAIRLKNSCEYVYFKDCTVDNIGGEGLYLGSDNDLTDRVRRITVDNCTFTDCDSEAIDFKDGVTSCFVHDCTMVDCGIFLASISIGGRYNIFFNCTVHGTRGANDCAFYIRYADGNSYSGRYNRIERCLVYDMTGTQGGIRVNGDHNEVINCTIVGCTYAIYGEAIAGSNVFKNNIFSGSTNEDVYVGTTEGRYDIDYNCYSDGATGVWYEAGATRNFAYVQGLGQETNGITTSANFAETGMYTLNVGSGCRNAGDSSVVYYDWNDEYSGAGAVDMGWREYGDYHEIPPGELPQRVFNSFFEDSGVFARFTGSAGGVTAAGNVPTPLVGQRQMINNISDATDRYAYRTGLGNLMHCYVALHVDVDSLTMAGGDLFNIFEGRTAGNADIVVVQLYFDGDVKVRAGILDDAAAWHYTAYFGLLEPNWNLIEIFWLIAPDASENEGELVLWVNAIEEEHIDGLNNHDDTVDRFYVGAVDDIDVGTSGFLYLDAVRLDWIRRLGEYYGTTVYTYTVVVI